MDESLDVELAALRVVADQAEARLVAAVREACPGPHRPVQHRDRRPPWCGACRRDARGVLRG